MSNENKEIGDIVKKCKILLLDIEGTTTSISFVKDKLFPYAEENVKKFLDSQWENEDVKGSVSALRKLALEDQESSVEGVVAIPGEDASKEDQIEGLVNNVKWQMSADRKAGPLKQLQGLIWKQGYDAGDIKGHVYDDVSPALEQWHSVDGQKIYIYSSGSVQAQKLLFGQSLSGDLLKFIDGHFDTAVGAKQEATSYKNIAEKIGCKPDEILFLTDIVKEAEAARAAGLNAALVSREGNSPLSSEATASFPVLSSLAELTVSNKRKPEPQEEEMPAKVPKTDIENNVKASADNAETVKVANDAPEKMDVDDSVPTEEELPKKEIVVVEEIVDPNEAAPVIEIEPIVEEITEEKVTKTEEKQADIAEPTVEAETANKKGDVEAPVAEETPPAVITEIEEISDAEKQLGDVDEIIEDLEPVIVEPSPAEEMEDLQNVGEVLEKECDEILSKVQNVTNLDNITIKPMLNPIAEETMETDNTDTNDIVDGILDSELDLEMKQCADIDLSTVTEMTEESKSETNEDKVLNESSPKETNDCETKVTDAKDVEAKETEVKTEASVSKKKEEKSSPTETKTEEIIDAKATDTEKTSPTESESGKTVAEEKVSSEEVKVDGDKVAEASTDTAVDAKPVEEKPVEENKTENGVDQQLNGSAANDDTAIKLNGGISNDEVNSRLAVENGAVNKSNGESNTEQAQGDCKKDTETKEIKVKTVTSDEPHTDPVEQPTEA